MLQKNGKVVKGTSRAVLLSIVIHMGLFFLAGALVVFTVVKSKEVEFEPPKTVKRPKMQLKKPKVKVKKTSRPKAMDRIVSKANIAAMPTLELPEMSGMGGDGLGGGLGGFDIMPELGEVGVFGSGQSIGNDFVGTFYDFQRDRTGRDIPVDVYDFLNKLVDFVDSGWNPSELGSIYRSPKKLYATCFMIPPIRSTAAPAAFGEPDTGGYCWMVHYKGQLVHKDGIRFRFRGQGDDLLLIRVGGEIVLIANWAGNWTQKAEQAFTHFWSSRSADTRKYYMGNNRAVVGDWITLEPGVPMDMDVMIGEVGGGSYCAMLAVEVDGVDYERGPQSNPILPMFKTAEPSHDLLDAIYKDLTPGEVCLTNGPVFSDYDTSGWQPPAIKEARPPVTSWQAEPRTWTRSDGQTVEAEFVTMVSGRAVLKDSNGKQRKIPLLQLADDDQRYIELAQPPKFKVEFSAKSTQFIGQMSPFNPTLPPKELDYVFTTKLKQTSPGLYNHELMVESYAIGAEYFGKRFVLLGREESSFIPTRENERSHQFSSGKPVRLTTYELAGDFKGLKYAGYLVVITDSRGVIIGHKTSNEWLYENLANLRQLPVGAYMDKTCTRTFPSHPVNNRY